jgi:hypothetical protein
MKRKKLPEGTIIEYIDARAKVLLDEGEDTLYVECDGYEQIWEWEFEGIECKIISLPQEQRIFML